MTSSVPLADLMLARIRELAQQGSVPTPAELHDVERMRKLSLGERLVLMNDLQHLASAIGPKRVSRQRIICGDPRL